MRPQLVRRLLFTGFPKTILHGTFSTNVNKNGGNVSTSQFSFLKEMDRRWQMAQRDAEARLCVAQAASQVEAREALRASEDRLRADQRDYRRDLNSLLLKALVGFTTILGLFSAGFYQFQFRIVHPVLNPPMFSTTIPTQNNSSSSEAKTHAG